MHNCQRISESGAGPERFKGLMPGRKSCAKAPQAWLIISTPRACDTRVYEYLLPSYTLLPPRPGTNLHQQTVSNAEKAGLTYEEHEFWKGYDHEAALEDAKAQGSDTATQEAGEGEAGMTPARRRTMAELARKRNFRISREEVERFRELMKAYLGTQYVRFRRRLPCAS